MQTWMDIRGGKRCGRIWIFSFRESVRVPFVSVSQLASLFLEPHLSSAATHLQF